jgi:hypothetical protein
MNGNGNGEVKRIVDLKHRFKDDFMQVEAELKAKFEEEVEAARKGLKDRYLEQVVDWFYGNGFNAPDQPSVMPEVVVTPAEVTTSPSSHVDPDEAGPENPTCSECGVTLQHGDKYCSQCSAPVREVNEPEPQKTSTVVSAGRRITIDPDRRLNNWARTRRR